MWIKLGNEYINLEHVIRIRFNKSFKKDGQDEWAADLEGFIRGELQIFLRYRGADAELLYSMFRQQAAQPGNIQTPVTVTVGGPGEPQSASVGTVHDLKIA